MGKHMVLPSDWDDNINPIEQIKNVIESYKKQQKDECDNPFIVPKHAVVGFDKAKGKDRTVRCIRMGNIPNEVREEYRQYAINNNIKIIEDKVVVTLVCEDATEIKFNNQILI